MLKARTETSQVFSVLQSLQDKGLPDGVEAVAAKSFHTDILQWILSGRAFKRRTGKLQDSIVYQVLEGKGDLVQAGGALTTVISKIGKRIKKEYIGASRIRISNTPGVWRKGFMIYANDIGIGKTIDVTYLKKDEGTLNFQHKIYYSGINLLTIISEKLKTQDNRETVKTDYAPLVEFGTDHSNAYTYMYIDTEKRERNMSIAVSKFIAEFINK